MAKSADAFRTISEVAEWLETPAHVLRFWESKFSQVKPVKRAGGRRYYRPVDMQLLGGIKQLLHEDGMTIKGVQKVLRENGVKHVASLSQPLDEVTEIEASEMAVDVTPDDEPPGTADVLSFRGGEAKADTTPTPAQSGADTRDMAPPPPLPPVEQEPDEDEDEDEAGTASTGGASAAAEQAPRQEDEADKAPTDASAAAEQAPGREDDEAPAPPVMPSFLQRKKDDAPAPEIKSAAPAPAAPTLTAPDIPDDPEDDAPGEPGPLSALARLTGRVDPDALAQMQELVDQIGPGPSAPAG